MNEGKFHSTLIYTLSKLHKALKCYHLGLLSDKILRTLQNNDGCHCTIQIIS